MFTKKKEFLNGCYVFSTPLFKDHRGCSVKPYHFDLLNEFGISQEFREDLIVTSSKGVIRGLHFQNPPYAQSKLIYCLNGSVMDVVIDIRLGSPTYGRFEMIRMVGDEGNLLYIPEGFAHGYLSMENNTIIIYKMSSVYMPDYEDGIRWDSVGIPWSVEAPVLSDRDKGFVPFSKFTSKFNFL